ncbi:hypothetical protein ILUMI_05577 [Ignelater luminosus]|uniref:Transposase n=1 Tax=Ignelater luminosus TaxID=2038154 RepID=A0A8K0D712_IGNLU|nr:hypothetical protein ILUMI_05577 [Ignelater luminosus]
MDRFAAVKKIDDQYQNMIKIIKLQLSNCSFVCTTADIWSFMGVTCHWIDQDLKRHSVALSYRRFEETHFFDKIGERLDEINKSFCLDNKKILATVTDNGSNFVKCFKEYGIMLIETSHDSNTDHDETNEEIEEKSSKFVSVADSFESESLSSEFSRFLPQHL